MDALDLFSEGSAEYRVSIWLYSQTAAVVGPGTPPFLDVDDAEVALGEYTELPLRFRYDSMTPQRAIGEKANVAVVTSRNEGVVKSYAYLPEDWFPKWDSRRRGIS